MSLPVTVPFTLRQELQVEKVRFRRKSSKGILLYKNNPFYISKYLFETTNEEKENFYCHLIYLMLIPLREHV
jgi:hypothetical protein